MSKNKSSFKQLPWQDQMEKMKCYLLLNHYPFDNMSKEKKRDFRRIAESYKLDDKHILYKRVRGKQIAGSTQSESKYVFKFC